MRTSAFLIKICTPPVWNFFTLYSSFRDLEVAADVYVGSYYVRSSGTLHCMFDRPFLAVLENSSAFFTVLCYRFAGAMERLQAESELINRVNSTYLVRHRTKESGEYAISIK